MGFNFPASPAVGTLYPASITVGLPQYRWDGEKWKIYAGSTNSAGTFRRFEYNATAGQSTFSGTDINGNVLAYTPNNIELFLNGTLLNVADYTASNGTSVVLPALTLNDQVTVVAFTYGVITGAVLKAGDTMTGDLTITKSTPTISMNKSASGQHEGISAKLNNTDRWYMSLANANPESTGNAGSDFSIYRYTDAGGFVGEALGINRATGLMNVSGDLTWDGAPWTAWTPTVVVTGGAGNATNGRYKKLGKTVHFAVTINITAGGSGISFTLPAGLTAAGSAYGVGREFQATGATWVCAIQSLTAIMFRFDNAGSIVAGHGYQMSGTFESTT